MVSFLYSYGKCVYINNCVLIIMDKNVLLDNLDFSFCSVSCKYKLIYKENIDLF